MGGGVMQQAQLFPLIRQELLRLLNGYIEAREITECIDRYVVPAGWIARRRARRAGAGRRGSPVERLRGHGRWDSARF